MVPTEVKLSSMQIRELVSSLEGEGLYEWWHVSPYCEEMASADL